MLENFLVVELQLQVITRQLLAAVNTVVYCCGPDSSERTGGSESQQRTAPCQRATRAVPTPSPERAAQGLDSKKKMGVRHGSVTVVK